jgi:hypothetical protein
MRPFDSRKITTRKNPVVKFYFYFLILRQEQATARAGSPAKAETLATAGMPAIAGSQQ